LKFKLLLILILSLSIYGCSDSNEPSRAELKAKTDLTNTKIFIDKNGYKFTISEITVKGMPCIVRKEYRQFGITCDWSKYKSTKKDYL
jgi:hypothetical protein